MTQLTERYINPFTDYGFKKLFGEEPNKELLLDFLNELLREHEGEIKDLTYLKNEHLGISEVDRKAIFDLYCENERGEKFIVELQKSKQNFFKDRTLYYSSFPIQEQAKRTNWNYELKSIYTIAILDFVFEEDKAEKEKYRYDIKLTDISTCKVFYNKLTFIYLEMPKFNKSIDELNSRFEKWLYVIKNLSRLDRMPEELREKIFERLFEAAEIAKMSSQQVRQYEGSLKQYRDINNTIDTARQEGIEIGEKQNALAIARRAHQKGLDLKTIAELTGLSELELAKLEL